MEILFYNWKLIAVLRLSSGKNCNSDSFDGTKTLSAIQLMDGGFN
jgi:hypothetical protein